MTMIPVNIATAYTGHKLQGRSKDTLIDCHFMTQIQKQCHSPTTELGIRCPISRVGTLNGLFLVKPLDTEKSYAPTHELTKYMKRAKRAEKKLMKKTSLNLTKYLWTIHNIVKYKHTHTIKFKWKSCIYYTNSI